MSSSGSVDALETLLLSAGVGSNPAGDFFSSSGLGFGISVLWWGWCFVRDGVVVRVGVVGVVVGCLVLGVVGWFWG